MMKFKLTSNVKMIMRSIMSGDNGLTVDDLKNAYMVEKEFGDPVEAIKEMHQTVRRQFSRSLTLTDREWKLVELETERQVAREIMKSFV
ncbi:hypothetical protein UFOVP124_57 [uncultured Caudovirales phage]|uniref:Uncharacterized protein n=1 Tax=uncultured Caudovirales phage TaxID=2100421 RepID=A0A6J5LD71_9CAUD|nr:hypothetical protein UFOVP124_57 [uncultured Caudovirales phage]